MIPEGVIRVGAGRTRRLARKAMAPWTGRPGYIPKLADVLRVIRAGLRPGETIASGTRRWTYLGSGELLEQLYAEGCVWEAGRARHPLLWQAAIPLTEATLDMLLVTKAQAAIKTAARPGVSIASYGSPLRR